MQLLGVHYLLAEYFYSPWWLVNRGKTQGTRSFCSRRAVRCCSLRWQSMREVSHSPAESAISSFDVLPISARQKERFKSRFPTFCMIASLASQRRKSFKSGSVRCDFNHTPSVENRIPRHVASFADEGKLCCCDRVREERRAERLNPRKLPSGKISSAQRRM